MSPSKRSPAVVAELGRPETPEETAARKAQDSRNHRTRQTANNLVFSLVATVILVAVIVLFVPRGQQVAAPHADFASIASSAQGSEPDRLLVPHVGAGWYANAARLSTKTADGVDSWYIGLLTPHTQYVGMTQGFRANTSWLASQVNRSLQTSTMTLDGIRWDVYDNRSSGTDNGNVDYALVTAAGVSTVVVFGTAPAGDIKTVAKSLAPQLTTMGAPR